MKNKEELLRRIKALEEENNLLNQIIYHMPGNVYWKNKEGVYIGCNKNAADLVTLISKKDVIGKTVYELIDKEYAEVIDKTDQKIMKGREEVTLEEEGYDVEKKPATYLSIKSPLFDQKNKVSGLLCISMDITRIKEAERVLIDAKNKAEKMNRLKSDFVNTVEHDIRAPFCGIHAMSSLLARQETDPDKKEALESIAHSSKASLDHATRLLSFAKIEEDFTQIISTPFSVKALIQSVVEIQKPFAQAKNLTLHTHIASDVPEKVVSDVDRLRGILVNLVSNAIKFTPGGYVKIKVSVMKKRKTEFHLCFCVEDSGVGIALDKQTFINKSFFSNGMQENGLYPGFGLGFPVIKKFIHDLKGKITIHSVVGKGTVITFTVPVLLSQ